MPDEITRHIQPQSAAVKRLVMKVRGVRLERGMSQAGLAEAIGVPKSVVVNWENDRRASITVDEALALSQALDVEIEWLMAGIGTMCKVCSDNPPPGFTCKRCLR